MPPAGCQKNTAQLDKKRDLGVWVGQTEMGPSGSNGVRGDENAATFDETALPPTGLGRHGVQQLGVRPHARSCSPATSSFQMRRDSRTSIRNVHKPHMLMKGCSKEGLPVIRAKGYSFGNVTRVYRRRGPLLRIRNRFDRHSYRNATIGSTFVARRAGI